MNHETVFKDALRPSVVEASFLLDADQPDWYREVNVGELEMSNPQQCILGQVYGDYSTGHVELGVHPQESGFENPDYDFESKLPGLIDEFKVANQELQGERKYELLEDLWVERIKERFDKATV